MWIQEWQQPWTHASLVIGLGTTGHEILVELRRRLLEVAPNRTLKDFPAVKFLCMETAQAALNEGYALNPEESSEINLAPAEQLPIVCADLAPYRTGLQNMPWLQSWVTPAVLFGKIDDGTGNVRMKGRLALFLNYKAVVERLQGMTIQAQQAAGGQPNVYVVGSLLGGTCSGTFIDLAYLVRKLITHVTLFGFFTIPQAALAQNVLLGNVYAALRELNHYNYADTQYQAWYPGETDPAPPEPLPPYDYTYLVGVNNKVARQLNFEGQKALIAQRLFLQIASGLRAAIQAEQANYTLHLAQPDDALNPRRYIAFGLSAIRFPREKVHRVLAYRLAGVAAEPWGVSPAGLNADVLQAAVREEMTQRGLTVTKVVDTRFLRKDQPQPLWRVLSEWVEKAKDVLGTRVRNREYGGTGDTLEQSAGRAWNLLLSGFDPQKRLLDRHPEALGTLLNTLQGYLSLAITNLTLEIDAMTRDWVDSPAFGIEHARTGLKYVHDQIEMSLATLQGQLTTAQISVDECNKARSEHLRELKDAERVLFVVNKGRLVSEKGTQYLDACFIPASDSSPYPAGYFGDCLMAEVLAAAVECFTALRAHAEALDKRLVALQNFLKDLRAALQQKQQDAEGLPNITNGEELWDTAIVDNLFDDIANQARTAQVRTETLAALNGGSLLGLEAWELDKVLRELLPRCMAVFQEVRTHDVVVEWMRRHQAGTPETQEALERTVNASKPYIEMQALAHFVGRNNILLIGMPQGVNENSPVEAHVHFVHTLDNVIGANAHQHFSLEEADQCVFLNDWIAYPLQWLQHLEAWKQQCAAAQDPNNPVHSRTDVVWRPIAGPAAAEVRRAWDAFVRGLTFGVLQREITAKGETVFHFVYEYAGQPHGVTTDPLGHPPRRDANGERPDHVQDAYGIRAWLGAAPPECRPVLDSLIRPSQDPQRKLYEQLRAVTDETVRVLSPEEQLEIIRAHQAELIEAGGTAVFDFFERYNEELEKLAQELFGSL
jgi:prefoldin subunit 5